MARKQIMLARSIAQACLVMALAAAPGSAVLAQVEGLRPLVRTPLPDALRKTFSVVEVTLPPGASAAPHRHGQAFVYAYVLEGAVRSQIEGAPAVDYRAGASWTEQPGAHHVLTRNLDAAKSARLLVVFVAPAGEPLKTDDPVKEP